MSLDVVTKFDDLANDTDETLVHILADAGLTPVARQSALNDWQSIRTALRDGVARWTARPSLTADEQTQLAALLRDLLDDELTAHANTAIKAHNVAANRAYACLREWNSRRIEKLDRPSPEAIAAMSESGDTFDTFEWRTNGDGSRVPVFRLKPSKENLQR
jgi:hypothetical protein